jgi:hypothetical protein
MNSVGHIGARWARDVGRDAGHDERRHHDAHVCLAPVAVGAASRGATRAWPSSILSVRTIVARWMRNFTTGSACAVIEYSTIALDFAGEGG